MKKSGVLTKYHSFFTIEIYMYHNLVFINMKKIAILFVFALSFIFSAQAANKFFGKILPKISKHKHEWNIFQKAKATKQEAAEENEDQEESQKKINCRKLLFSPYYTLYSTLNIKRYFDNCFKTPRASNHD